MYSQNAWGGSVDPHILVNFTKVEDNSDLDLIASLVIFEWKDYDLIGASPSPQSNNVCFILFTATKTFTHNLRPEGVHMR